MLDQPLFLRVENTLLHFRSLRETWKISKVAELPKARHCACALWLPPRHNGKWKPVIHSFSSREDENGNDCNLQIVKTWRNLKLGESELVGNAVDGASHLLPPNGLCTNMTELSIRQAWCTTQRHPALQAPSGTTCRRCSAKVICAWASSSRHALNLPFLSRVTSPGPYPAFPAPTLGSWERFGIELVLTFIVVFTHFSATDRKLFSNNAMVIGAAYTACSLVAVSFLSFPGMMTSTVSEAFVFQNISCQKFLKGKFKRVLFDVINFFISKYDVLHYKRNPFYMIL